MEELVRIEGKVSEAVEAAAEAAAHAVEATKAAEAASLARAARKAEAATTAKAAKSATTATKKAEKAARAAKAADLSIATAEHDAFPTASAGQEPCHVVEVKLTADELELIERLAAEKDASVQDLVRFLLRGALGRSDEQFQADARQGRPNATRRARR